MEILKLKDRIGLCVCLTLGRSCAMALAHPSTAAHPPISNFMSSIMDPAPTLRLYPPESNVRPLPTRATWTHRIGIVFRDRKEGRRPVMNGLGSLIQSMEITGSKSIRKKCVGSPSRHLQLGSLACSGGGRIAEGTWILAERQDTRPCQDPRTLSVRAKIRFESTVVSVMERIMQHL
jgi:hypothetical protein